MGNVRCGPVFPGVLRRALRTGFPGVRRRALRGLGPTWRRRAARIKTERVGGAFEASRKREREANRRKRTSANRFRGASASVVETLGERRGAARSRRRGKENAKRTGANERARTGFGCPRRQSSKRLAKGAALFGKIGKNFKKGACGFALFGYNLFCCWGAHDFQTTKP